MTSGSARWRWWVLLLGTFAASAGAFFTCSPPTGKEQADKPPRDPEREATGGFRPIHTLAGDDLLDDPGADAGVGDPADSCSDVRTIDRRGRPVPNALVVATLKYDEAADEEVVRRVEARTDGEGVATLCAPAHRSFALGAWADDGRWAHVEDWEEPAELVLLERFEVHGRVVDRRGAPIAGATIHVAPVEEPRGWSDEVDRREFDSPRTLGITGRGTWTSGADGRFRVPIGALGRYRVAAESDRHPIEISEPIAVRPGRSARVRLLLGEGAMLHGTVSSEGQPVPGVGIRSAETRHYAVTDANGAFSIGPFSTEQEEHPVYVDGPRGFVSFEDVFLMSEPIEIELVRQGSLEIRARVADTIRPCVPTTDPSPYRPVMIAAVELRGFERLNAPSLARVQISDLRRPSIVERLAPGRVDVVLLGFGIRSVLPATIQPGVVTQIEHLFELPEGEGLALLRIDLPADMGDNPIFYVGSRNAPVYWTGPAFENRLCAALPEGTHQLVVRMSSPVAAFEGTASVNIVSGRITEARVSMAPFVRPL